MLNFLLRLVILGAILAPLAVGTPALANDRLEAIIQDYDRLLGDIDPISAGQRGNLAAAARWPDVRPQAEAHYYRQLAALQTRLQQLPAADANTDADARLNRQMLGYRLQQSLRGQAFDESRLAFSSDYGFYHLPGYVAGDTRLRSLADAQAYLTRLASLPAFYAAHTDNLRRGLRSKFVQSQAITDIAVATTRAQAQVAPADDPLYAPLLQLPASFSDAQRDELQAEALQLLERHIKPAQRQLADFMENEYRPEARRSLAASALPGGRDYYRYLVERETTTSMTPDEVFALGEAEVRRIRKQMEQLIVSTGFAGSFADYQQQLRSDPRYYASSRQALLERSAWIAKRIDDQLPAYFGHLPRLPYGVREVPRELEDGYTTGRYFPGSPERRIAGGLMINTSHLDQRPLYELPALIAHEGVPGHHLQIALAQELSHLPQFRRDDGTTAFVEGWALYTEQLAAEMGIYQTADERFGQLSMEMWRACRLVMDVGLHWKGWSREKAMRCLQDNSALSAKNIETETDRYISWPGQALGYKIGQLKITELRRRAQTALGPRFDLRAFHDLILEQGAMPLQILESRVDAWIAQQLAVADG